MKRLKLGSSISLPGQRHLLIRKSGSRAIAIVTNHPEDSLYKPCVNILMNSVADVFGRKSMGVILTGMGNDGMEGMKHMKSKDSVIIAQNEASCVVYGMPKAVVDAGIADHIAPIENISNEIVSYF